MCEAGSWSWYRQLVLSTEVDDTPAAHCVPSGPDMFATVLYAATVEAETRAAPAPMVASHHGPRRRGRGEGEEHVARHPEDADERTKSTRERTRLHCLARPRAVTVGTVGCPPSRSY
jgi:hypothetical protein